MQNKKVSLNKKINSGRQISYTNLRTTIARMFKLPCPLSAIWQDWSAFNSAHILHSLTSNFLVTPPTVGLTASVFCGLPSGPPRNELVPQISGRSISIDYFSHHPNKRN